MLNTPSTRNCRRCAKKDVTGRHALHTMVGRKRLDHLQAAVETVLREGVPGDLIETGVWRGGSVILMRGVLAAYR